MNKAPQFARLLLGLIFTLMGLNGFFQFLPMPPMNAEAGSFMGALAQTGYFFPLLKITEIVCGVLLLAGRYVSLALVVLAPVVLNIIVFHLFLAPEGLVMGGAVFVLEIVCLYYNRQQLSFLLKK